MKFTLAERTATIQPSATLAIDARAKAMRREGLDVLNLSAGEPDFDTPDFIKHSAELAIRQGFTKYTPADGIIELKQAIQAKFIRDNQLDYSAEEIIVTSGVKHGLANLCSALLNPGDQMIIPAPYWVSYPALAKLAGATPVIISASQEQNFKITAEQLDKAITPQTKLFMLNSPSNPTGKAYTTKELAQLGEVLERHPHVVIASDDIYEYILWGLDRFVNILNVCPSLRDRTVVLNGMSKAYAMTGWRVGYAAGPTEIISAMKKLISQNTGNPNSIAQKASVVALKADPAKLDFMFNAFKNRHDQFLRDLQTVKGFNTQSADGTFYLFPNVEDAIRSKGLQNDVELAAYLLEQAQVAAVPGSAFGMPGHLRFSYATSDNVLSQAAERLKKIFD